MRDDDPTTGRYLQADPLGLVDGASVYGYAMQNPSRYFDPRGEQSATATAAGRKAGLITLAGFCAAIDGPIPAGDIIALVILGVVVLTPTEACGCDPEDDCAQQWREAYKKCADELGKTNPSRGLTGGHTTIQGCARGFVSERCLGNKIDWGEDGPPPGWTPG